MVWIVLGIVVLIYTRYNKINTSIEAIVCALVVFNAVRSFIDYLLYFQ